MPLPPRVVSWISSMNAALVARFGVGAPQIDNTDASGLITANIGSIIPEPVTGEPSMGTLHMLSAGNKQTVINALTTLGSGWSNNIDCSSYCPAGFKGVRLQVYLVFSGDGTSDYMRVYFRKGGSSSETSPPDVIYTMAYHTNLGAGLTTVTIQTIDVEVDSNGIFDCTDIMRGGGGTGAGSLTVYLHGYWI